MWIINYTKLYEAEVKLVRILINENIINNLPQEMHSRCSNDHDCSFDSNLFRRQQKHFDSTSPRIRNTRFCARTWDQLRDHSVH